MAICRKFLGLIIVLLVSFCAGAQPMAYQLMGKAVAANNWIFVDSASARANTTNQDSVWTPARDYTNATVIIAQAVDYPAPVNASSALSDNKGNTYVALFSPNINNQRIRYYMCFNPVLTGGGVILTYACSVTNYPALYAQAYRGVTVAPSPFFNHTTSTASISSISTNSVTSTSASSVVVTTVATQANISTVSTVSGAVTASERMNWFPFTGLRNTYSASYNSIKSSVGTFSVTHTTSGANFNTQTVAAIAVFN